MSIREGLLLKKNMVLICVQKQTQISRICAVRVWKEIADQIVDILLLCKQQPELLVNFPGRGMSAT